MSLPACKEVYLRSDGFSFVLQLTVLGNWLHVHHLTSLQTLRIRLLDLSEDKMAWVLFILNELPSGTLRRVTFDIWLWSAYQLRGRHWDAIRQILNLDQFRGVETVSFVQRGIVDGKGPLDMKGTKEALSAKFPELRDGRRLHVEDGGYYALST